MQYNDAESFPISFTLDNPIIIGRGGSMKVVASQELAKLQSKGKAVYITDSYLFVSNDDTTYESDVLNLLKELNAREIHYCVKSIRNQPLYFRIQQELDTVGCLLTHDVLGVDCHDRFWLCKETNKAIVFGTSLNGLCKKICRISELNDEEVLALIQALNDDGITI
ncbi:MAG: hypothetical protein LUH07_05025 [Lachnospiraceae bacterium]|nr:hypothetical protein [Lachnospiraceae bacterium]